MICCTQRKVSLSADSNNHFESSNTVQIICRGVVVLLDSEKFWQMLLQRDFGVDAAINKDPGWNQVLNIKFPDPHNTPIFGVDPAHEEFLLTIETGAFDVWKYWLKADARVLPQRRSDRRRISYGATLIYAPYFLRAARFWQTVFRWCDADNQTIVGEQVRASMGFAFEDYAAKTRPSLIGGDTIDGSIVVPKTSCRMALLAIYSFSSGQGMGLRTQTPFDGLLGGYHAYSYYSSMCLTQPSLEVQSSGAKFFRVAVDFLGYRQGLGKAIYVDQETGKVVSEGRPPTHPGTRRLCYSSAEQNPHDTGSVDPPKQDDFLRYLEEYARRLATGQYRVGKLGTHADDPDGITLFPQPPITGGPESLLKSLASSIPLVSRAVTRGVEVMGSAVFAREAEDSNMGFIYCIRCRLLRPGEDGYQSAAQRGFETCQLSTRHWLITNDTTGRTSIVEGQGVIGMYPVLREDGYENGNEFFPGVFQYQSCTGAMGSTGSFGGHITFVPGRRGSHTGDPFMAELQPFLLDDTPNFLY
jgi:uncharacterized protein affecting Mg2+/Co2+ transport